MNRLLLGCSLVCCVFSVRADERPISVFSGEYVIERLPEFRVLRSGSDYSSEPIGRNFSLVKSGPRLRSGSPSVVPYVEQDDLCPELLNDPSVKSCSPNFVIAVEDGAINHSFRRDPKPRRVIADNRLSSEAAETVVAVLDTGLDYNHPLIRDHIWTNTLEIPGNGIDDDGNGYIDDLHGANIFDGTGDPLDDNGHGTHVSGIVASQLSYSGSEGVKIVGVKFLNARGLGGVASAIQALDYVVDLKKRGVPIKVSNNSWGGAPFSEPLLVAVDKVLEHGIVFVAAAGNVGNNNDDRPEYPASFNRPGLVSVAAVDVDGNLANFSNYGSGSVAIAAPGVRIKSSIPGGGYRTMSGTSMAAPFVSGVLGVLIDRDTGQEFSLDYAESLLFGFSRSVATLSGLVEGQRLLPVFSQESGSIVPRPNEAGVSEDDQGSGMELDSLDLAGVDSAGLLRSYVKSRYSLRVVARGVGSGVVPIDVVLGGEVSCNLGQELRLENGVGSVELLLPKIPRLVRSIAVTTNIGISRTIRVKRGKTRRESRSVAWARGQQAKNFCTRLRE